MALLPPGVTVLRHGVPAVQRIAPALTGRAEVIGRHACDHGRFAALVEQVLAGMGPDVGRVVRDKNGRVARDQDAARIGVLAQALPLHVKTPLHETPETGLGFGFALQGVQCCRVTARARHGPLRPGFSVAIVQHHEQRIVVQPVSVAPAKFGQRRALRVVGTLLKAEPGAAQRCQAVRKHALEVAALRIEAGVLDRRQPSAGHQIVEIHQPRAAGEG